MIAPNRSLGFTLVSNCVIYVGTARAPTDSDWDCYLEFLRASFKPLEKAKALVIERGFGLRGSQRQRLDEATAHMQLTVSIVTDSKVIRLVVNAASWFKLGYRAFASSELDDAIAYLEMQHSAFRIKDEIKKLCTSLDDTSKATNAGAT